MSRLFTVDRGYLSLCVFYCGIPIYIVLGGLGVFFVMLVMGCF